MRTGVKEKMKNILFFGDSNTYGYRPQDGGRYPPEIRWSGILASKLAVQGWRVIEEGLVGRTTVFEDSLRPGRKGSDFLVPLLESHSPVHMVGIMLGTNDCKSIYKASSQVIGLGMERLIKQVRQYDPSIRILLISPIHLGENVWQENFDPEFDQESVLVSKQLKSVYQKLAEKYGINFLAASDLARPSAYDQEHLTVEGHAALAEAICRFLTETE